MTDIDREIEIRLIGLDDPEHDVKLMCEQISKLIAPMMEENDPYLIGIALQEIATQHSIKEFGTLAALKILIQSMDNVVEHGPYVEAQLKGVN